MCSTPDKIFYEIRELERQLGISHYIFRLSERDKDFDLHDKPHRIVKQAIEEGNEE